MKMSKAGLAALAKAEGFRNKMYKDVANLDTIGVGHLITDQERTSGIIDIAGVKVAYKTGLTDNQVEDLLAQDVVKFETVVNQAVTVDLTQTQFDTLVSFCYNVGPSAFKSSTLCKKLNAGDYECVPEELMRWTKAAGRVIPGLVNRRQAEAKMWKSDQAQV